MTRPAAPLHPDLRGLSVLITLDAVGGVWRYAMDLAAGLRQAGCDIRFAGFGPPPDAAMLAEASRLGAVGWSPAPLDWTAHSDAALDPARAALARLCRDEAVDLLHLNAPPLAAAGGFDLPVVAVSHSCLATWHEAVRGAEVPRADRWNARATRDGLCAAQAAVAPSLAHAAALGRVHDGLPKLRVVHNAVPLAAPAPAAERDGPALAAGRWWDAGKNAAVLDRAAGLCRLPVVMAGALAGPNGDRFSPRHARATGPLPHADLRRLMATARVFVAPSRYEPFGLAVAEAAQAGLPLVLADIPTFRELWPDTAAIFVDPDDAAGLAAAIDALAADPVRAARMGAAARAHATRYRPARQVAGMAAVYRRALDSGRETAAQRAGPPRLTGVAAG